MARSHIAEALGQAMRYALGRWDALTHYLHDGRIEIDNNAAERSIRGIAMQVGFSLFPYT